MNKTTTKQIRYRLRNQSVKLATIGYSVEEISKELDKPYLTIRRWLRAECERISSN